MKPQKLPSLSLRRSRKGGGLVFLIIACMFLCSCAMGDSVIQKADTAVTVEKPETFYVGLSGLKLFPEPRFSGTCIATLTLHEEVLRDKLEKGFAHVRVLRTGQTGWVNNAHLLWRAPSQPKPPAPEPPPEKRPREETVIQAPSHPNPEVEGRDASIFNRF